jgi:lipopolysaccharide biosynthesis protein
MTPSHPPAQGRTQLITFHLPQFYPTPQNDVWWGKGFTEWTSVTRTTPRFRGHYQPHLPADLGFYDLRMPEARAAQADLARQYGLGAFCYYHYWFMGDRLLERPVDELIASGQPDFPYCLCWANHHWTRNWDGQEQAMLQRQDYSVEDDHRHFEWLSRAFRDPRYLRLNGRPVFLIYRGSGMPDVKATLLRWRDLARKAGIGELFLAHVESSKADLGKCREWGFDAGVEHAPNWAILPPPQRRTFLWRVLRKLGLSEKAWGQHAFFDYGEIRKAMTAQPEPDYLQFRTVLPMWDNSARRKSAAYVLLNSSPAAYQEWLEETIRKAKRLEDGSRVVFINAWNEWAEGNHLEPCQKWGHAYLEATQAALRNTENSP